MIQANFFDYAENSYRMFMLLYKNHCCFNDMAVNAANAIEKYLKHIAMVYENASLQQMPPYTTGADGFSGHNIKHILTTLETKGAITVNYPSKQAILRVNHYLYTAKYPDMLDSRVVNQQDIDNCKQGLVVCRNLTLDYIKAYENEHIDDQERAIEL